MVHDESERSLLAGRTLPRRWSIRSKSKEITTMTEQTEATIHVGVYSSVISGTTAPASAPPPPAMDNAQECQKGLPGWVSCSKVASCWGLFIVAPYITWYESFSAVGRQRDSLIYNGNFRAETF